jgi:hypothetical protein
MTALYLRTPLLVAVGAAHATQPWINVSVLKRGGRIGEACWDVKSGPMFFCHCLGCRDDVDQFFGRGFAGFLMAIESQSPRVGVRQ